MNPLQEQTVSCPYCGERIEVLLDPEDAGQQYTEDCQVCCRPMVFSVQLAINGELYAVVQSENEA